MVIVKRKLENIREVSYEHNLALNMLFIGHRQAYDVADRNKLNNALR